MKWCILGIIILLLLPFYVFLLNKSAMLGKIGALRNIGKGTFLERKQTTNNKEVSTNGKEEK